MRRRCTWSLCALALAAIVSGEAQAAQPPDVSARAAALVDARDGHALYGREARSRRAIASATKLMTALIAIEELPLGRRIAAAPYAAGPLESRIGLRPGERMSVVDLLRALLLESANDAAVTLARGAAGSVPAFVRRMNERARELGLSDTRFANPIGLDQRGNYSSAVDLARLTRRLLSNDTFATIVDQPSARLRTGARPRVVDNRNRLVARVAWMDGVKTGHTRAAGYVLVGSGTRKGAHLLSVVLGEPSEAARDGDTLALLRFGFSSYRRVRVLRAGATVASADVAFFGGRRAQLTVNEGLVLTLRRGQRMRTDVRRPEELEGPLAKGERVGSVRVFNGRRLVRSVPLITAENVPEAGLLRRASPYLAWAAIVLATAAALALAVRRGRA